MNKDKNHLNPLITKRRSIVSFSGQIPDEEDLNLLFDAARWAASSHNQQPWRFISASRQQRDDYQRLLSLVNEGNLIWASRAPVLILSVAEVISDYKNRPNRFAFHDLGMAVANMALQASYMGLYIHQMGGYDAERAKIELDIPEGFEPGAMIAVGYPGEIDNLPVELKRRELAKRRRKELNEFVFKGKFGL